MILKIKARRNGKRHWKKNVMLFAIVLFCMSKTPLKLSWFGLQNGLKKY